MVTLFDIATEAKHLDVSRPGLLQVKGHPRNRREAVMMIAGWFDAVEGKVFKGPADSAAATKHAQQSQPAFCVPNHSRIICHTSESGAVALERTNSIS